MLSAINYRVNQESQRKNSVVEEEKPPTAYLFLSHNFITKPVMQLLLGL